MASCEICGSEEARFVCSSCGRKVGPSCFSKDGWLCKNCLRQPVPASQETESTSPTVAMTLLFIAFIMIFAGTVLLFFSISQAGQGGFVVIFPFFFASSNSSSLLVVSAVAILVIMLVVAFLSFRKSTGISS